MIMAACTIVLMVFRPTVASRFSRLIEFSGGAIDDSSSASTPARNLVIRSNFKVRLKVPNCASLVLNNYSCSFFFPTTLSLQIALNVRDLIQKHLATGDY